MDRTHTPGANPALAKPWMTEALTVSCGRGGAGCLLVAGMAGTGALRSVNVKLKVHGFLSGFCFLDGARARNASFRMVQPEASKLHALWLVE